MIAFSFDNRAEAATLAASTTFTEAEAADGLRHPERPHLRGYSSDLSAHRITLDFGSAASLQVIAAINANFTAASVQGNATDTWGGPPTYNPAAITIGVSGNDRYHHAHRPTVALPFNYRYASLSVPTGATTDGATRWALGGIWAGLLTLPPQEILIELDEEKLEFYQDTKTPDGRTVQRVKLDDHAFHLMVTRRAYTEAELAAWRVIDARWSAAPGQAALVLLRASNPEEAYVMRQTSASKWHRKGSHNESDLELLEVTA